jgi:L-rhamnose isomerase
MCRSDLFGPDPNCKKEIKINPGLLTHLNKKHDVTGRCCKDQMRHFWEDMYLEKIHTKLMTRDGECAGRQRHIESSPAWNVITSIKDMTVLRYTPKNARRCTGTCKRWGSFGA